LHALRRKKKTAPYFRRRSTRHDWASVNNRVFAHVYVDQFKLRTHDLGSTVVDGAATDGFKNVAVRSTPHNAFIPKLARAWCTVGGRTVSTVQDSMSAGSHRRCPVCPADENGLRPPWEKCGCWNVPCVTGPEATDVQCRKCRRWVLFSATHFSRCAPIKKHGSGNCEARYCPQQCRSS
jgi:hypothetical protein